MSAAETLIEGEGFLDHDPSFRNVGGDVRKRRDRKHSPQSPPRPRKDDQKKSSSKNRPRKNTSNGVDRDEQSDSDKDDEKRRGKDGADEGLAIVKQRKRQTEENGLYVPRTIMDHLLDDFESMHLDYTKGFDTDLNREKNRKDQQDTWREMQISLTSHKRLRERYNVRAPGKHGIGDSNEYELHEVKGKKSLGAIDMEDGVYRIWNADSEAPKVEIVTTNELVRAGWHRDSKDQYWWRYLWPTASKPSEQDAMNVFKVQINGIVVGIWNVKNDDNGGEVGGFTSSNGDSSYLEVGPDIHLESLSIA